MLYELLSHRKLMNFDVDFSELVLIYFGQAFRMALDHIVLSSTLEMFKKV